MLSSGRRKQAPAIDPAKLDRLPPYSPEAEQGVLGCVLLAGNDLLADFASKCPPGNFYDLRHQTVGECIVKMWNDRVPVDTLTLMQRLKDAGTLEKVGGVSYLMTLANSAPSSANFDYYTEIIREKATLRQLLAVCSGTMARVYKFDGKVESLLDEWERDALRVGESLKGREGGPANIPKVQARLIDAYDAAQTQGRPMGLLTGYSDIDHKCGGMMGKELIVVAGERSAGKTTLALNVAVRVAQAGTKVAFYSMDGSAESLLHRIHCMLGPVDGSVFRRGNANESDMMAMQSGIKEARKLRDNLLIYDCHLTGAGLMAMARSDWQRGARLFVVDYLQCIESEGDGDTEKATNTSKLLKRMAIELDSPVIVVSSLNRDFDGRPRLRNLRQSGQIEYDANKVLLLSTDDATQDPRAVLCDIAKNKDGALGDVDLTLFAAQFRFESAAMEEPPPSQKPKRNRHNDE